METLNKHKYIILISFAFAILYSSISIVNHYCFRTYALDLGLYTNAAFKYAHFQIGDSTMIKEYFEPILGGHFDLYLILFSPLTYIFGTYTLIIVQVIALIIGGIGIYRYFSLFKNRSIPLFATLYFFLFFGIYSALSYDYHSVVVASCIVPWFFVAIHQGKMLPSSILFLSIIISQENISLWMLFICTALAIEHRKNINKFSSLLMFAVVSITYFFVTIFYIIPSFSHQNEYGGMQYSYLGSNVLSVLKTIISHPIESFKILFTNHTKNPYGDFVKAETHVLLLISGLFFLIRKPLYILMLVPIYCQKFFHNNYNMWGIGGQYNIEFAPILSIGIFSAISEIKRVNIQSIMNYVALILVLVATVRTMDNTVFYTDKSRIRFYQKDHYKRDYKVKIAHQDLLKIPKDAKVSAQSPFVPHLSLRYNIYEFPIVKDAEYIIYSSKEGTYPLLKKDFEIKINELEASKDWEIYYKSEITILRKLTYNRLYQD